MAGLPLVLFTLAELEGRMPGSDLIAARPGPPAGAAATGYRASAYPVSST